MNSAIRQQIGASKPRVAYVISHGHTARWALQTGLLEQLSTIAEVHVIAAPASMDALRNSVVVEAGANEDIHLHPYEFKLGFSDSQRAVLRNHIHQDIRTNPALWEKHLRRIRSVDSSLRRRWINHLYYYAGASIRTVPGGKWTFRQLDRKANYRRDAEALLEAISPDLIISTRPVDPLEISLLEASERLGIHKVFYILSWDNITSKGTFAALGDSYLTWGPIMNDELRTHYSVPTSSIFNTGITHFDVHAQVREQKIPLKGTLEEIGLDDRKPYLFFTMSASYYAPNEIDVVEHLARQVEQDTFGTGMQLVVRPHMVNLMADRSDQSWLARLEKLDSKRVKVDFPEAENSLLTWFMAKDDMIRLSGLLNSAAVCLNSGSTVAIESLYLDRPVVITAFDTEEWPFWRSARRLTEYEHLKKLFATGACQVVENLDGMTEAIQAYLSNPKLHSNERQQAVALECHKNDGQATSRFVANIRSILEKQCLAASAH